MLLWVWPAVAWAVHKTVVSASDIFLTVSRPLVSTVVAGAASLGVRLMLGQFPVFPRLVLECTVLLSVFAGMLLFAMGQKSLYLDLLRRSESSPAVVANPTAVTEAL